ncbi:hypothetical protein [Bifidobacterium boum]|nr:hypothetical protein [Bifidobacterium boum]MCI5861523.1 hypothetical protein [Bifidobacterium boum]
MESAKPAGICQPTDPTLFLTAQAWATRRHGGDIGFGWCDGVDGGARI